MLAGKLLRPVPMRRIDEDTLLAYAEGELPADEAINVAFVVAGDASLASRVTRQRMISAALRQAYAGVLEEPIPEHLLALLGVSVGDKGEAGR
ncbi:MAG: NepR family anti-sigma factor [Alphaproteobacteria bacterium]